MGSNEGVDSRRFSAPIVAKLYVRYVSFRAARTATVYNDQGKIWRGKVHRGYTIVRQIWPWSTKGTAIQEPQILKFCQFYVFSGFFALQDEPFPLLSCLPWRPFPLSPVSLSSLFLSLYSLSLPFPSLPHLPSHPLPFTLLFPILFLTLSLLHPISSTSSFLLLPFLFLSIPLPSITFPHVPSPKFGEESLISLLTYLLLVCTWRQCAD